MRSRTRYDGPVGDRSYVMEPANPNNLEAQIPMHELPPSVIVRTTPAPASTTSTSSIQPESMSGASALIDRLPPELGGWLALYLRLRVDGVKSARTVESVRRDLARFEAFYWEYTGCEDVSRWLPQVTKRFLEQLQADGLAPATVARTLASTRAFAKFLAGMRPDLFPLGEPTLGAHPPVQIAMRPQGLTERQLRLLTDAAYRLVCKNHRAERVEPVQDDWRARADRTVRRPWRDYAVLLLLGSGLRRDEVRRLDLCQLRDGKLVRVQCKGNVYRDVLLGKETLRILQAYLEQERERDAAGFGGSPALLLPSSSRKRGPGQGRLSATAINRIVARIAAEANACLPETERFTVHPHRLRHTHAYRLLQKGQDLVLVQRRLGHRSMTYLSLYTQLPDEMERAIIDDIEVV